MVKKNGLSKCIVILIFCVATMFFSGCSKYISSKVESEFETLVGTLNISNLYADTSIKCSYDYRNGSNKAEFKSQITEMSFYDRETYEIVLNTSVLTAEKQEYKNMDGVLYSLVSDDENMTITEKIIIDCDEISGDNYEIIMPGTGTAGQENVYINIDLVKQDLINMGYTIQFE